MSPHDFLFGTIPDGTGHARLRAGWRQFQTAQDMNRMIVFVGTDFRRKVQTQETRLNLTDFRNSELNLELKTFGQPHVELCDSGLEKTGDPYIQFFDPGLETTRKPNMQLPIFPAFKVYTGKHFIS